MRTASKINKLNNFICGWYIDKKVCKDLIEYFEKSDKKTEGCLVLKGGNAGVNKKRKASTDVVINLGNNDKEIKNYLKELNEVVGEYKKKYKYCDVQQDVWGITEGWNIQKYKPTEGYFLKHFERTGGESVKRHLVFMTYLNDVHQGGETEFMYQKLKVKPQIGLTLIWGSDWTFTHRGVASPAETKYITTGWYSFFKSS